MFLYRILIWPAISLLLNAIYVLYTIGYLGKEREGFKCIVLDDKNEPIYYNNSTHLESILE